METFREKKIHTHFLVKKWRQVTAKVSQQDGQDRAGGSDLWLTHPVTFGCEMCSFSPLGFCGITDKQKLCVFKKVCKYLDICLHCGMATTEELINICFTSLREVFLKCWTLSWWIHVIRFMDLLKFPSPLSHCWSTLSAVLIAQRLKPQHFCFLCSPQSWETPFDVELLIPTGWYFAF